METRFIVETTGPPAEAVNHQRRQARVVGWPAGVVRCDLPQRPVALAAHVTKRDVAFASRGTFTGSQEMQMRSTTRHSTTEVGYRPVA
jgi:hypothetical protein